MAEIIRITLEAARVNKKMTQADVAKALHVGKYTVCNWERGRTKPSFATLQALERLYGIPYDNFILN